MKIKLFQDAALYYVRRCYKNAPASAYGLHSQTFRDLLEKVQGKWLDVETDYLFSDQFNTAPIAGVSESGLRVMWTEVEFIQDDFRLGRVFDSYTHKHHSPDEIPAECLTDERESYLKLFKTSSNEHCRGVKLYLKELFPKNKKII